MSGRQNPSDFLKQIIGRPVVVKLNSGVDYRGRRARLFFELIKFILMSGMFEFNDFVEINHEVKYSLQALAIIQKKSFNSTTIKVLQIKCFCKSIHNLHCGHYLAFLVCLSSLRNSYMFGWIYEYCFGADRRILKWPSRWIHK